MGSSGKLCTFCIRWLYLRYSSELWEPYSCCCTRSYLKFLFALVWPSVLPFTLRILFLNVTEWNLAQLFQFGDQQPLHRHSTCFAAVCDTDRPHNFDHRVIATKYRTRTLKDWTGLEALIKGSCGIGPVQVLLLTCKHATAFLWTNSALTAKNPSPESFGITVAAGWHFQICLNYRPVVGAQ